MIWPLSKFIEWAEKQGVKDANKTLRTIENVQQRIAVENAHEAEKGISTMKKIVMFCLANGVAWVWCSYILAFLGRDAIAESLSQIALAEIIGVVLTYAIKSVIENISKHNSWPDKCYEVSESVEYNVDAPVGYNNQEDYTDGPGS